MKALTRTGLAASEAATQAPTQAPTIDARPQRALDAGAHANARSARLVYALPLVASLVGLALGGAALFANPMDALVVPALGLLALTLLLALAGRPRSVGRRDRAGVLLLGLSLGTVGLLTLLPEYLYGAQVNGIIHRSALSGPLLLLVSVLVASYSLRGILGATPTGQDLAVYPLLILPVVGALVAYGLLLGHIVASGAGGLSWELLTTAYQEGVQEQDGVASFVYTPGLWNNIAGTILLMGMTSLIAILPGVGAGWFMNEYPGRLARLIDFCTTMLRAVSVFIIGAAAFGAVRLTIDQPAGTLLSDLVRGSYEDDLGLIYPGKGSFLTASVFLSLLVIPIIAKLTEEGLRSIPREIREGSIALGATEGHGLRRILLPWAAPNILTGVLLGAAEAAGSLAIIMFIAGTGQFGVGPLSEVTSLDYALFATKYGSAPFKETMAAYRFTAALLLLFLTLGLTVIAMLVRRRFGNRYRRALTAA